MTYECQRCGACCRWPGQVRVSDAEIAPMAAHLGVSVETFIDRYTRLRPDRLGLALLEKDNYECIFLDGVDCRVQPVKPQQCRTFPNEWNVPEFADKCRATTTGTLRFKLGGDAGDVSALKTGLRQFLCGWLAAAVGPRDGACAPR